MLTRFNSDYCKMNERDFFFFFGNKYGKYCILILRNLKNNNNPVFKPKRLFFFTFTSWKEKKGC